MQPAAPDYYFAATSGNDNDNDSAMIHANDQDSARAPKHSQQPLEEGPRNCAMDTEQTIAC